MAAAAPCAFLWWLWRHRRLPRDPPNGFLVTGESGGEGSGIEPRLTPEADGGPFFELEHIARVDDERCAGGGARTTAVYTGTDADSTDSADSQVCRPAPEGGRGGGTRMCELTCGDETL